jgi:hypothetical protein
MPIYLIRRLGVVTNEQIGERLGLTFSVVSHRMCIFKQILEQDKVVQRKFDNIKSLIKI